MNTLGLQMYTLRDYLYDANQTARTLQAVKKMGYDAVQIWPGEGMSYRELSELVFAQDLEFAGAIVSLSDLLDRPDRVEEAVKYCRSKDLILDAIPDAMRRNEEGYHYYAELLTEASRYARQNGYVMHYHPHAFEFCNFEGVTGMDILLQESPADTVHFMLDTHWVQAGGGSPAEWIRRIQDRISIVHFKDYGIDVGTSVLEFTPRIFAPVGKGNLNWDTIIEACRAARVHTIVVEQDECKGPAMACAKESIDYLRKTLNLGG